MQSSINYKKKDFPDKFSFQNYFHLSIYFLTYLWSGLPLIVLTFVIL